MSVSSWIFGGKSRKGGRRGIGLERDAAYVQIPDGGRVTAVSFGQIRLIEKMVVGIAHPHRSTGGAMYYMERTVNVGPPFWLYYPLNIVPQTILLTEIFDVAVHGKPCQGLRLPVVARRIGGEKSGNPT